MPLLTVTDRWVCWKRITSFSNHEDTTPQLLLLSLLILITVSDSDFQLAQRAEGPLLARIQFASYPNWFSVYSTIFFCYTPFALSPSGAPPFSPMLCQIWRRIQQNSSTLTLSNQSSSVMLEMICVEFVEHRIFAAVNLCISLSFH